MNIHEVRSPLLTNMGREMIKRLTEHPDAPRFNYVTGDRLWESDLPTIEAFRKSLKDNRKLRSTLPPDEIFENILKTYEKIPYFRRILKTKSNLKQEWNNLPTISRADLALRPWEFVPDDQSLERLVIFRTAGTTGHPISVPHHPIAIRCYEPMIEFVLQRYGIKPEFAPDKVACLLIGAQIRTYTYATVLNTWQGAGFAKINIRPTEWPKPESVRRYIEELSPLFLSGDPISFSEMMHAGVDVHPAALITTSVAMNPGIKIKLQNKYNAPVIDWYSMVETGPIGYACPAGNGYHLLPVDLHAEIIKSDGTPAKSGERGEIVVTGGRNPMFPLLRYRTGDFGRMDYTPCPCGDPMPRFIDLEGRTPVLIRSADKTPVSSVDISRLLREFPLLNHEFIQHADLSCDLIIRPLLDTILDIKNIENNLQKYLGGLPLKITLDPQLGDRQDVKATPYRSELILED